MATTWTHSNPILSLGPPPPLPPHIAPRKALVNRCHTMLRERHALSIVGATGMGKTTLAKLASQGTEWAWFNFSSFQDESFAWVLKRISTAIDGMPQRYGRRAG
jgi:ATP/maltotriose-dependent transcriptional regulator MalT